MWFRCCVLALVAPVMVMPAAVADTPPPARWSCQGVTATVVGSPGADVLLGTRGRDVIVARGGADRVDGRGGDDLLCGGAGSDRLLGGPGDDRLLGGRDGRRERGRFVVVYGDRLDGGAGDDHLDTGVDPRPSQRRFAIQRRNSITFAGSPHAVTLDLAAGVARGQGADVLVARRHLEVTGSRHDDVLLGSGRDETLDGRRGADEVSGRGGRDLLLGDHGVDTLDGGGGTDFVVGHVAGSTLAGGRGMDFVLAGSKGPATVLGGPGSDLLSRTISGGETGTIDGGGGPDQLELDLAVPHDRDSTALVDAGAGTAVVTGTEDTTTVAFDSVDYFTLWGDLRWTFLGSDVDNFVQVLFGPLDARGLAGDDTFIGDERRDLLDGDEGDDAAWGGGGRNTCVDAERGECDGYPWGSAAGRARVVTPGGSSLSQVPSQRLVSRWAAGDLRLTD